MKTSVRALLTVLAVALLAGACGDDSGDDDVTTATTQSSLATTSTTSADSSSSTTTVAPAAAKKLDVCATVPVADVAAASGLPLDETKAREIGFRQYCDYDASTNADHIKIAVQNYFKPSEARAALEESKSKQSRKHDVSGVGESAWYDEEYGELQVLQGSLVIYVSSQAKEPTLTAVAKMALPKVTAATGAG
jgi:hypothetical protein